MVLQGAVPTASRKALAQNSQAHGALPEVQKLFGRSQFRCTGVGIEDLIGKQLQLHFFKAERVMMQIRTAGNALLCPATLSRCDSVSKSSTPGSHPAAV